jgi:hypothetical protein
MEENKNENPQHCLPMLVRIKKMEKEKFQKVSN